MATPEYYNACAGSNGGGVPVNDWGYQEAQDGNAYAGIATYSNDGVSEYREYIEVKLLELLSVGVTYHWCLWVSLLDSTELASNNIGVSLTNSSLISSFSQSVLNTIVYGNNDEVITENIEWTKIGGSFIANGGESHLTIGNFYSDVNTDIVQVQSNTLNGQSAYYYIDNVYLGKSPCRESNIEIPNVFTPNNDGVNDYFFTTDSGIKDKTIRILNRWGNLIFEGKDNDTWDGQFNNAECNEGIYFYSIEYFNIEQNTKEQKTGFIQLIR
ncbi:MAG TPA: gliding motility-associated C-terminal domain-containing protein [Crocinitomicaceae bacterium]|nr:gliding motility-associated C-terminal domain-containing protein [Crocinitomicaceae bacterium]